MKRNKEGTDAARSARCAHEKKQGGHRHRRKPMLCPRKETRRAQTPSGTHTVPMKRNKEGTDAVRNPYCAHEKKQGGHSRRQEHTLCPRKETRRAQTPSQAHAVPTKRNKEGTAAARSARCAHEMEQGGHRHRQELTLCPRENKCLHLDRNMM